jgi:putative ABC transport system permease protein
MLKNHFKIAWRNLLRDRQFSFLNLMGLSIGLASTFMIYLWVNDELDVDKFNEKDKQLYQVMKTAPGSDGSIDTYESTPAQLAQMMAKEMPEIEFATSVFAGGDKGVISVNDKYIKAHIQFVDDSYLKTFSYPLIHGKRQTIDKYSILISNRLALKLFNTTENIIGKPIKADLGNKLNGPYTIAGVFQAPPLNATRQFDVLFSYSLYYDKYIEKYGLDHWNSNSAATFVILKEGTDVNAFNEKIRNYSKEKYKSLNGEYSKWEGRIFLQRYSERYLYNQFGNDGIIEGGRIQYVNLFSIVAMFILAIACINFMNLSTARASKRMKEVGIRKVIGAPRKVLMMQYLAESILMAFLALVVSVLIVLILLPAFRDLTQKELTLNSDPKVLMTVLGITLFTGLIAGSYPAFYLSGFKPIAVLKGKLTTSAGESSFRKGLVIFQFTISVVLIVSVLVVYQQVKYVHSKNLGYNKDNIIRFKSEGNISKNLPSFVNQLKSIPGVVNASDMGGDLMGNHGGGGGISWTGKPEGKGIEFDGINVDYDMMEMFDLKMVEGRMFSRDFGYDSAKVIFNESAVAAMNLKNPVGQVVTMWGKNFQIIGVVKDFNYESLYNKVGPFFMRFAQNNDNVMVKLKAGQEQETLARLETFYKNYNLGLPFEYRFVEDDYQTLYASEQRVAVLSKYFAIIAILISCLGLYGLAAFTAQKRQKEIGIRKVIGASVGSITMMLSKDFLKLILVAVLVAFPLAWWAMHRWLQSFAYRISIDASVFVIAGFSVVLITLLTISFQAVRAAIANPIKSLRSE